jgi:hypothetical protein
VIRGAGLAALAVVAVVALGACSFPTKHPDGDAGTADAATPFGCQGAPFGTTAPAQIMMSGQALDLGTGVAAAGTAVTGVLDAGGALFTGTTDASGSFSALVDTHGKALAGHVVTTAGTYAASYFYPAHPFDRDTVVPLPMLEPAELEQPPISNPTGTALAQLILGNCLGAGLAGCTLTVTPAPQRIVYAINGKPDPTAAATDATGYALVYGVVPGPAQFAASCPTGPLRPSSIAITASSTYFIQLEP